jgi:hypothetical protein
LFILKYNFLRYLEYKKKLKCLLDKLSNISVTTDLWKNRRSEYFLSLTGHFFDSELNFHSLILAFRKFNSSHTSQKLKKFIICELKNLGILEKVISITTDNEASIKLACSEVSSTSKRYSCMAHNLNLCIKNGLRLWTKPNE